MKEIYIDCGITQNRAGLFIDGKLEDLFIENVDDINISGNIYKGRVENIVNGLNAAFINIGSSKNAILHFENMDEMGKIKRGSEVLVQVIREPSNDKGARVTTDVCLTGRYIVLEPGHSGINISRKIDSEAAKNRLYDGMKEVIEENYGIIIRTEALDTEVNEIIKEYILLKSLWDDIQKHSDYIKAPKLIYDFRNLYTYLVREFIKSDVDRIVLNRESDLKFLKKLTEIYNIEAEAVYDKNNSEINERLEKEISSLFERKRELPSGGFIYVEKTEAMIVFDVNSGSFINTGSKNDTVLKTNIEAGIEIARIIKLCNFSGIIIIDFIDMQHDDDKNILIDRLSKEFKKDRMPVRMFGFTKLGLMEISRPRKGKTVFEALYKEYFSKTLNHSYMLKIIENECLRYSKARNSNKFDLYVHPDVLAESEESLKFFKDEMLSRYDLTINYIYSSSISGISLNNSDKKH